MKTNTLIYFILIVLSTTIVADAAAYPSRYGSEKVIIDAPWRVEPMDGQHKIPLVLGIWNGNPDGWRYFCDSLCVYIDDSHTALFKNVNRHELFHNDRISKYWSEIFWVNGNDVPGQPDVVQLRVDVYLSATHDDVPSPMSTSISRHLQVRCPPVGLPSLPDWYMGDSHAHSVFTNQVGQGLAEKETGGDLAMIQYAGKAIGLKWVTITDHPQTLTLGYLNSRTWADLVMRCQENSDDSLIIFPGEEMFVTSKTHMASYGVDHFITSDFNLERLLVDIGAHNGFAFAAHPEDGHSWTVEQIDSALFRDCFAGLQIWNTCFAHTSNFDTNENMNPFPWEETTTASMSMLNEGVVLWDSLLQTHRKVKPLRKIFIEGGTDSHGDFNYTIEQPWDYPYEVKYFTDNAFGKVRTAVYCPHGAGIRGDSILTALRNGHSVVTNGPVMVFHFSKDPSEPGSDTLVVHIGDERDIDISAFENNTLKLLVEAVNSEEYGGAIDRVNLVCNGTSMPLPIPSQDLAWDAKFGVGDILAILGIVPHADSLYYFRMEAFTSGDSFRCYTNPVWLKIIKNSTRVDSDDDMIPDHLRIKQNYPNPFNSATLIEYTVPVEIKIYIDVFDLRGIRIRTLYEGQAAAGHHQIRWDARDDSGTMVNTGLYLVQIRSGRYSAVVKALFVK
jgi:hypothetical protein